MAVERRATAGEFKGIRSPSPDKWPPLPFVPPVIIPARCVNSACGTLFFVRSPIILGNGNAGFVQNLQTGRCPVCKSRGRVADGEYRGVESGLMIQPISQADFDLLEQAASFLAAAISADIPPKELREKASREMPGMDWLWRMIPQNQADARKWCKIAIDALEVARKWYRTVVVTTTVAASLNVLSGQMEEILNALQRQSQTEKQTTGTPPQTTPAPPPPPHVDIRADASHTKQPSMTK